MARTRKRLAPGIGTASTSVPAVLAVAVRAGNLARVPAPSVLPVAHDLGPHLDRLLRPDRGLLLLLLLLLRRARPGRARRQEAGFGVWKYGYPSKLFIKRMEHIIRGVSGLA